GHSAPDPPLSAQIQPGIVQVSICAIRRNQTTIRKNRSVTFVGGLSLAAGDKNDTRGATSMWQLSSLWASCLIVLVRSGVQFRKQARVNNSRHSPAHAFANRSTWYLAARLGQPTSTEYQSSNSHKAYH